MAVSPRSATRAEPNSERSQDLTIDPSGALRTGRAMMTFVPGDERSFLVAYLKLVRWLRHQKSAPEIVLRRAEIELLADHLGADPADILERLATLMGATTTQRRALVATFATGAAVIFLAVGASAATGGSGGTSLPTSTTPTRDAAPATIVGEWTELHDALPLVVITSAPPDDEVAVPDELAPNPAQPASTPPAEATAGPAAAAAPVAIPPTAAVDDTAVTSTTDPAPVEVAVGEPPVPTPPYEVAVGEPPVPTPPYEVAVGEPPVPTPPGG